MTTDYAKGVAVRRSTRARPPASSQPPLSRPPCSVRTSSALDMGGTSADIAVVRDGRAAAARPLVRPRVGHADPLSEYRRRLDRRRRRLDRPGSIPPATRAAARRAPVPIPGPACYGKGGEEPTNTDAHLVLGRRQQRPVPRRSHAARRRALGRARCVRREIAEPLGLSLEDAAEGMLQIANANMVKAIRSRDRRARLRPARVQPRRLRRRGPLHAVDLARELQMPEVIVPPFPGVTSAMGLLFVDPLDDFSWAYVRRQDEIDLADIRRHLRARWRSASSATSPARASRGAEIARRAQPSTSATSGSSTRSRCRSTSSARGLRGAVGEPSTTSTCASTATRIPSSPVETSTLRVAARGAREKPDLAVAPGTRGTHRAALPRASGAVHFDGHGWVATPVLDRTGLSAGDAFDGPCIVEELDSTVVLPPARARPSTPSATS